MAKRGKGGRFTKKSNALARAPAARVQIIQATPVRRRRKSSKSRAVVVHRRRRRSGGGSLGGFGRILGGGRMPLVLGGAALGFAHKEGWLNKLPVVGKAGPITSASIIGWAAEELAHIKLPTLVHDAITAGLVLSAFNLGFSHGETIVGQDYPGGAVFFE